MKRVYLYISLFCLIALSGTAFGEISYPLLDSFHLRVSEYEKVFEQAYSEQQIEDAFYKFSLQLENELALVYQELLKVLPRDISDELRMSHLAWLKYRERHNLLIDKIYGPGRSFSIDRETIRTAMVMQHIEELYVLLQDYEASLNKKTD